MIAKRKFLYTAGLGAAGLVLTPWNNLLKEFRKNPQYQPEA